MKNKQVKQMMVDVENTKQSMLGYKTCSVLGWHGFDESGLFHFLESNIILVYQKVTVSLTSDQIKRKVT